MKENEIAASSADWFAQWFDTPYYELLYAHRGSEEAENFVSKLCTHINICAPQQVLDAPCGTGRHAHALALRGLQVTGIDLSEKLIKTAQEQNPDSSTARFFVHDLRHPFASEGFDWVLNLFTSFGYFESPSDNQAVMHAFAQALKNGGHLLIDFMNAARIRKHLTPFEEERVIQGIRFRIQKRCEDKHVIKEIAVQSPTNTHHFKERVALLELPDFQAYFSASGLQLLATYGSYAFDAFDAEGSERLLMLAKKINPPPASC